MDNVELRVYDQKLTPLGVIDEIASLLWTPTYWNEGTVGDLKLLAPMTEKMTLKRGQFLRRRHLNNTKATMLKARGGM